MDECWLRYKCLPPAPPPPPPPQKKREENVVGARKKKPNQTKKKEQNKQQQQQHTEQKKKKRITAQKQTKRQQQQNRQWRDCDILHSLTSRYEIYTVLFISVTALGQYDVFTTCPALYTVGQLTPITCTINSTKVAAATCSLPADNVQLFLTKKGSVSSVCAATYPPPKCTPASGGKKCGCVKQDGDIFTFVFEFMPNSTDKSEKLRCEVDCPDAQNLTQGPACAPITFSKYLEL